MDDRSRQPLDMLIADLLDQELFTELLTTYDDLSPHDSTPPVSPSPSLPPSHSAAARYLARFEIIRELGRGGGGIVFLAFDPQLRREIALKVPHPEVLVHRQLRKRFLAEAQAAAALKHSNIVPVYEAGEIGPICYIASEYSEGPTLAEWLKDREAPVDARVAAELVATLADAVEHAHRHGILHRDLKPSNVLLECSHHAPRDDASTRGARVLHNGTRSVSATLGSQTQPGNQPKPISPSPSLPLSPSRFSLVPKLTDFGLAKMLESDNERTHTRTTAMVGTPAYMSPEQAEGRNSDIGCATDVYGLGAILYELLTGQPPFQRDSDIKLLQAIASPEPPRLPRRIRRDVPRDLEAICLKCLEKKANQRYATATELADELRRFLDWRPTVARPDPVIRRIWKWSRRRPAWAALALLLALGPVALGAGYLLHDQRVEHVESTASATIQARDAAERERTRRHDYASHIQGAYQAWHNADLKSALALLDRCRPKQGQEDLRGWEWYYVRRLCAGGLLTLRGHDGPVRGVAFSPDGRRLASCDAEGVLRIWDVTNGQSLATVKAHKGGVNGVAYSPAGLIVATVGDDGYLRLWNAETCQPDAELHASNRKLLCVAFSRDGSQIAAAGDEPVIRICNITSREVSPILHGHSDTIQSVAFSPTENVFASGSADGTARVWKLITPREPPAVFDATAPVVSVAFSPDGKTLVTGDSQIRLWDLSGREGSVRMNSHEGQIRSVAFSPNAPVIASASEDMTIRTWNAKPPFHTTGPGDVLVNASKLHHTYRGHTKGILCAAFSPQGDRLASAGKDGTIQIWDPMRPQHRQPLKAGIGECGAAIAADGVNLAVAWRADPLSQLELWNTTTRQPPTTVPLTGTLVTGSVTFSPNSKYLAFSMENGSILLRDLTHGVNRVIAKLQDLHHSCAFSYDSKYLAVASSQHNGTRILDVSTGKVHALMPGQRAVAFSPDGRLLATQSGDVNQFYAIELWDITARRSVGRLAAHTGEIDAVAFSADGRFLASGSADGTARLWSVEDHTERYAFRGHRKAVSKVAFLLNQRSLATASIDGTVKIWNVDTGQQLLSLDVAVGHVYGMTVSADGRTLVTASSEPSGIPRVELWTAPEESGDD